MTWSGGNVAAGLTAAGCRSFDENRGGRENRVSCTRTAYGMNGTPTAAVVGAEILHCPGFLGRCRANDMSNGVNTIAAAWFGGGGRRWLCGNLPCRADGANRASSGGNTTGGATTAGGRSAARAFRASLEAWVSLICGRGKVTGSPMTAGGLRYDRPYDRRNRAIH